MKKLSAQLEFEEAAQVRDEIKRLEILELQIREGDGSTDADSSKNEGK
jgi:excinuclease ABC subunit B